MYAWGLIFALLLFAPISVSKYYIYFSSSNLFSAVKYELSLWIEYEELPGVSDCRSLQEWLCAGKILGKVFTWLHFPWEHVYSLELKRHNTAHSDIVARSSSGTGTATAREGWYGCHGTSHMDVFGTENIKEGGLIYLGFEGMWMSNIFYYCLAVMYQAWWWVPCVPRR